MLAPGQVRPDGGERCAGPPAHPPWQARVFWMCLWATFILNAADAVVSFEGPAWSLTRLVLVGGWLGWGLRQLTRRRRR